MTDPLQRRLGHRFKDPDLLLRAITHPSRAEEEGNLGGSYERLEFLGDAVLSLVVAERLMERNPDAREGRLTRSRASLVNRDALARCARNVGLDAFVRLGRGAEKQGARSSDAVLADVFEAVLGAIHTDGGFDAARAFLDLQLGERMDEASDAIADPKTRLNEALQRDGVIGVEYRTVTELGAGESTEFHVEVRIDGRTAGAGVARSKKEAEQVAAEVALRTLGIE